MWLKLLGAAIGVWGFLALGFPGRGLPRATFLWAGLVALCGLMNIPMLLFGVGLRFISRRLGTQANCYFAGGLWYAMQMVAEKMQGMTITVSGDKLPKGENAIVISNHQSFSDFYMIHHVALQAGMLTNCKYFVKKSLQYIPFFGWGMWMMEMIAVSRNWMADRRSINRAFENTTKYKIPMWLIVFTEGTRQTKRKLKESQEFCDQKKLPVFKRVLYPRKQGFIAAITALRNSHIQAVYDFTLVYQDTKRPDDTLGHPDLVKLHCDPAGSRFKQHVHVRRFEMKDLPTDDNELAKWLEARWAEKDAYIDATHAKWPVESGKKK